MNMQFLIQYAMQFVGKQYYFGGDDPISGFDCSGFVSEILRACGVLTYAERLSAQQLFNRFENFTRTYGAGSLSFYGASVTSVSHVGFCLDDKTMLEAGGGTSTTKTLDEAILHNAFVRMRPILYRRDFLCVIRPQYPGMF